MTNEYLIDVFKTEYDRLISGGKKRWMAQMGAIDQMYNAAYSERLKEDGKVILAEHTITNPKWNVFKGDE